MSNDQVNFLLLCFQKTLYDIHVHFIGKEYLKAKPLFWSPCMQHAKLHFSVGFIWWASQADVHSSWTGVSCQRNMWTDHWRGDKEGRLGPEQDLSVGCSKGDCPWVQTQWHQSSAFKWGEGRKKNHVRQAPRWWAKLPKRGYQVLQQKDVIFKCQLYHDRPKPPWMLRTLSHPCAPCLRTDTKNGKTVISVSTLSKKLKHFLKLFECHCSHL